MREGYNPYLITPYKKKKWLYIIQFQINGSGAYGNTLWHTPLHHVLRNNKRKRVWMQKVAFTFIFITKSLLHFSDII